MAFWLAGGDGTIADELKTPFLMGRVVVVKIVDVRVGVFVTETNTGSKMVTVRTMVPLATMVVVISTVTMETLLTEAEVCLRIGAGCGERPAPSW